MNHCYKCLTIEHDTCLLGKKCEHYDKQNLKDEIIRRISERQQRNVERLMKLTQNGGRFR